MALDFFIKFNGIKGDSTDDKHKEWIEMLSFSHELNQVGGGSASAQGTHTGGRVDHGDFSFSKNVDSSTPVLSKFVCDGKPIPEVDVELCRSMGEKTVYMTYKFMHVVLTHVGIRGEGSGGEMPEEDVSCRYSEIHWAYTPTNPEGGGKTGAEIKAGWSTQQNKPL